MNIMSSTENVKQQFSDDSNLIIRINFYKKYCTNKISFVSWLFDKYSFEKNDTILELGCGSGTQWEGRIGRLPQGCTLILSDFSDGMINIVREKFSLLGENICVKNIDVQSIPFEDASFNVVIANHMLFHVPNLHQALSEIRRVMKTGGHFYAATDGIGGMRPFLYRVIKAFDPETKAFHENISFSLQNGEEILKDYFRLVKKHEFADGLAVTETQDLIDWLKSTTSISAFSENNLVRLYEYFETIRARDGVIRIPKETGLFVGIK